jgi:hypothetical protein
MSIFGRLSPGLASCLAITRTILSEWTQASFVLVPLATSHEVQPPVWLFREPIDLSGLYPNSSPWLFKNYPLRVFEGRLMYIVHCAFVIYFYILTLFCSFPYFIHIPSYALCSLNFWFLNNIVWLLFTALVLEMHSRYFELVINHHLQVNKHPTSSRLACFHLSIGFWRPIPADAIAGFAEPIYMTWIKAGETHGSAVPETEPFH